MAAGQSKKLVNIFDKLGMIENFGTGIPWTFDTYKNEEKQPVFEATENFFYVTLPNLNYVQNDQINELDLIILKAIHNNPGIKVPEILRNLTNDGNQVNENQIRNSIKKRYRDLSNIKDLRKQVDTLLKINMRWLAFLKNDTSILYYTILSWYYLFVKRINNVKMCDWKRCLYSILTWLGYRRYSY